MELCIHVSCSTHYACQGAWLNVEKLSERAVLKILTWKCVLRRSRVHFWKCSDAEVFLPRWLPKVLRAIAACNLWSLIWPNGSAPAALASLPLDPPERQNIEKQKQCLATVQPFRVLWSSFYSLSLLWLFRQLFLHLSISRKIDFQTSSGCIHILGMVSIQQQ